MALHDKYLLFVSECFQGSSLFHKALKEAFEAFCNRPVGGSQMSELMANYCDALLRKGSSGVGASAAAAAGVGGNGGAAGGAARRAEGAAAASAAACAAAAAASGIDGEAPSLGAGASAAAAAAAEAAAADAAGSAEDNVDLALEKVIDLLPYVSDKDIFSEYYKKKLGRRLLFSSGHSNDDAERSVLARLKQQCGSQFTSKMEGMLTDLSLAREKQNQFNEWRATRAARIGARPASAASSSAVDLSVTVLTTGFWPKYPSFDLQLPAELAAGVAAFSEFYEATNLHRKLTWQYTIGSCHLRGNFSPRPLELVLATTQAAALMMFNDAPAETLPYSELRDRLQMPDEDAQRVLASLSVLKHRVLLKRDGSGSGSGGGGKVSRKISPSDVFSVNAAFTDRMRRVKIPLPPQSAEEKKKVIEDVTRDRCNTIDAALVRVMKARKVLSHKDLLLEVMPMLAKLFQPDPKVVKKQIESLIEREYMARDADRATVYKYLA